MGDPEPKESWQGLLALAGLAVVAGAAIGFVGGAFRWLLGRAAELQGAVVEWARAAPVGWLVPVLIVAATAAAAATIVRFVPRASGSGIQHVEAVERGESSPPPIAVLPARFVGGLLAIGSGLVLGREGPTVHMGATIGTAAARLARRGDADVRTLQTALSGAGLAVAFNAPIGGAIFVFEEITKQVRMRMLVPTLLAVTVAIACSRLILGDRPDFAVRQVADPPLHALPLYVVLGAIAGLLGVLYSRAILGAMDLIHRVPRIPPIAKAAVIGGLIGTALFLDPLTVGGGDALTQLLLAGQDFAVPMLLIYLVVRFLAGPMAYSIGTPGGIFAPLLALGALMGTLFASFSQSVIPGLGTDFGVAMAMAGMTALFSAVVRAPLTGIVLVIEMTAVTTVTVPMLVAGVTAVLTARLLRAPPIYDSLRERMLAVDARAGG